MRHFRIKEIITGEIREYFIQYTVTFLFIKYWKTYNKIPYQKYEDALFESKKIININKDYTKTKKNQTINYHYIDVFRFNRNLGVRQDPIERKHKNIENRYNRSTFIPKNEIVNKPKQTTPNIPQNEEGRYNRSTIIPRKK